MAKCFTRLCRVKGVRYVGRVSPGGGCEGCAAEGDGDAALDLCGLLGECRAEERADNLDIVWVPERREACHGG